MSAQEQQVDFLLQRIVALENENAKLKSKLKKVSEMIDLALEMDVNYESVN